MPLLSRALTPAVHDERVINVMLRNIADENELNFMLDVPGFRDSGKLACSCPEARRRPEAEGAVPLRKAQPHLACRSRQRHFSFRTFPDLSTPLQSGAMTSVRRGSRPPPRRRVRSPGCRTPRGGAGPPRSPGRPRGCPRGPRRARAGQASGACPPPGPRVCRRRP